MLPPVAPAGALVALPRLEATLLFEPVPMSALADASNGSLTAVAHAAAAAIHAASACDASPSCEVTVQPLTPLANSSAPTLVAELRVHIEWPDVNRTEHCAPSPPKAPGVIDNATMVCVHV